MIILRNRLLAAATLCILGALTTAAATAQPAYEFNLPQQSLADALRAIGRQTTMNILFEPESVENLMAPAVRGLLSPEEAIKRVLVGTKLVVEQTAANSLLIALAGAQATSKAASSSADTQSNSTTVGGSELTLAQSDSTEKSGNTGNTSEASSKASEDNSKLEEIVVTAEKHEELLINTPLSVTVLSADNLTQVGATQLRDYANSVPGLSILTNGAGDMIASIRGITVGTDVGPTVGFYVDDVPVGSSSSLTFAYTLGFDAAPFDLKRIEVLKGPQGTLYGASAMSGLIKYVTRKPSADEFAGGAQIGLAGIQDGGLSYSGSGNLNLPIVQGKMALRFSAFESHDGGYITNVARHVDNVNRSDMYGGRLDVLATPSDNLSIRLNVFAQNIDRDGIGSATYTLAGAEPYGSLGQNRPTAEPFRQRFQMVSGTVNYTGDWGVLTSVTSFQSGRTDWNLDVTQLLLPFAQSVFGHPYGGISTKNGSPTDKFVQELRLNGPEGSPLEWIVGGFYNHESSKLEAQYQLYDTAGQLTADNYLTNVSPDRFEEYAAFGTLTWHLTPKLAIAGGIRYAHNSEQNEQQRTGIGGVVTRVVNSSDSVATYLANARYHLGENSTLYARFATGYRPGGPNFQGINPLTGARVGPPSFEADHLRSYEIGFKSLTASHRLGINLAAFQSNWDKLVTFFFLPGVAYRDNGPDARVRGGELSLTTRPAERFNVSGSLIYLDAHILEANAGLGARSGDRLPTAPRLAADIRGDYKFGTGVLEPSVGISAHYISDRKATFDGSPLQYMLPEYTTVDVYAALKFDRVDLQLYARNLFDERGQLSAYTSGSPRIAVIPPRTIGLTATARF